jgi:hypothetical protein
VLAQPGSVIEITTTRSQVIPELRWMQDLNVTLETPASPAPLPSSPAPALSLLSLQQQVSTLDLAAAADTGETEQQIPAPVDQAMEHLLVLLEAAVADAVPDAVPDAAAQKEPVLAGTKDLQPPLQPTPAKVQPAKIAILDDSYNDVDEMFMCLGGETCTVCGKKCQSVSSLQQHILKEHCAEHNKMFDMLEMQMQLLNTILKNQTTQENTMKNIAASQKCVISDIKELKVHMKSSPAAPPVPAVSGQDTAAACPAPTPAPRHPNPPAPQTRSYAETVAPAQTATRTAAAPAQAGQQAAREIPAFRPAPRPRGKRKVLFLADSVNRCLVYPKLENPTGSLIRQVNCYSSQYDERAKHPQANVQDVLRKELAQGEYHTLVLGSPTVDILNQDLSCGVTEVNISEVIASASNMVEAAEYGIKSGKVKQVIVLPHPPSYDSSTAAALRKLATTELKKARDKSECAANILVGEHTGLECDGQTRVNRFTSNHTHHFARQIRLGKYDGYHKYSQEGAEALTSSMLHILQTAGMVRQRGSARQPSEIENDRQPGRQNENWQAGQQGRGFLANGRQAARQETGQFEIQTSNMFADFC